MNSLNFNPEMLTLAREADGLTLRELATKVSFSSATISRYESGLLKMKPVHLNELSQALNRPVSYFVRDQKMFGSTSLFHRRRKRMSVRDLKRVDAQVNEIRIEATTLLYRARIETKNQFHRLESKTPQRAARELRRLWNLPTGPIRNVVNSIESAGGIVFDCGFAVDEVDGVSQWPLESDAPPVFFIFSETSGDRQRFTLCHEIGHVVLHHKPSEDPEREANQFASEFLMPADEVVPDLQGLTLKRAADLKVHWRVSMAAIVRRAFDLKQITERQYRYLNMQISKLGYRRVEPIPLPREKPKLFSAVLNVHRSALRRDDDDLSNELGLYPYQLHAKYGHGVPGFKLVG